MLQQNTIYHMYNHANGDDNLFRSQENYQFFLNKMACHLIPFVELYAYCLMPNHFHLLLKIKNFDDVVSFYEHAISSSDLHAIEMNDLQVKLNKLIVMQMSENFQFSYSLYVSKQFSNLFSSYTQAFNKLYKRRGSLFIKNFKRKEVDSLSYFKKVLVYIHKNPMHHGFVSNFEDWNWHSYHLLKSGKSELLNVQEVMKHFVDLDEFSKFHYQYGNQFEVDMFE